jgi:hypothetical protein
MMSTLIGVLLDVSGSMKQNIDADKPHAETGPWVRSIFKVIDNLIKYDVSSENHVFAIAFGASGAGEVFDVLRTIEEAKDPYEHWDLSRIIDEIFSLIERNGARYIHKWAERYVVYDAVSRGEAVMILKKLESDSTFRYQFVYECLPSACREWKVNPSIRFLQGIGTSVLTKFIQASRSDIKEVVRKAKDLSGMTANMISVTNESVLCVHDASNILHGCVGKGQLTDDRAKELLSSVEPFIYGGTPLFMALKEAVTLFKKIGFNDHKKLLFVLSDGQPADSENNSIKELRDVGVTVVSCYITGDRIDDPKRLYSVEQAGWEETARFMFDLSSTLTTQLLPRTIFIKRGWNIDIDNNETRLFVQVNHPDIIDDVCDLARNVVCCQDAMSDILSSVSLDLYINQCNTEFSAKRQRGGTCYANASAAVLHLAMKRIAGRDGGYPDFFALRDEMIQQYGRDGANTYQVLQAVCPRYRLRCKAVDNNGALHAVAAKRPVVATFRLTDDEWEAFYDFYNHNPTGILTKSQIDITRRQPGVNTGGHAVVLTSFNIQCLRFMNSCGSNWADMGFFRVEKTNVLDLKFFDVFWKLNDLSAREKAYYEAHGHEVATQLMATLKGLQLSKYTCPLCHRESLVTEFKGNLVRAKCPKCNGEFRSDEAGNILALNMYLTSLGHD